jgi:hypothetical protein
MNAIKALPFAFSEPFDPAKVLRTFFQGVRQFLPTVSRGHGYQQLINGYEQMANARSTAGDKQGASYLAAHAAVIRGADRI